MKMKLLMLSVLLFAAPLSAQDFKLKTLASGLGITWGMTFIDNDHLLFTQREGSVGLLNISNGRVTMLGEVEGVLAEGQGGLLDVAVPSDFKPGDWIYFTYSKDIDGEGATTLARAKLGDGRLVDWQDLLVTQSVTGAGQHYGSRIAFDNRGYLYFGIGDRGRRPNSQDRSNHAGSILRLKRDGSVPGDNPFVGDSGVLPEIWSYGHRNPQGLTFDPVTQRLWEIEHGPRGGDEINRVEKGTNYGWPVISYGKEYWGPVSVGEGTHKPGMQQPVKYYVPSIAPSSLMVYQGNAFPEWKGALMAGALKLRHLNIVSLDAAGNAIDEDRILEDLGERIRSLTQDKQGYIYFATDSGKIYQLKP